MVATGAMALALMPGISAGATTSPSFPPNFSGESCVGTSFCVAVGTSTNHNSAEAAVWNGTSWRAVTVPDPRNYPHTGFTAVSCPAVEACTAVGYADVIPDKSEGLVERWNGSRWRVTADPRIEGQFEGVSCPTVSFCMASGVGGPGSTVVDNARAAVWRGHRWQVFVPPTAKDENEAFLDAVSCSSPTACTAVGGLNSAAPTPPPLIERWNGSQWHLQTSAPISSDRGGNTYLSGVSCPTATACTAVGVFRPEVGNDASAVIEHWNGAAWARQTSAAFDENLGSGQPYTQLQGVSCPTATTCVAVGFTGWLNPGAVAEGWDGTTWSAQTVAVPAGNSYTLLNAISCPTATTCGASGFWGIRKGHAAPDDPLADGMSDGVWSQQLPSPS